MVYVAHALEGHKNELCFGEEWKQENVRWRRRETRKLGLAQFYSLRVWQPSGWAFFSVDPLTFVFLCLGGWDKGWEG